MVLDVCIYLYIFFFHIHCNIIWYLETVFLFVCRFYVLYDLFVYFRVLEFHLDLNRRNPSDSVSGSLRFMAKSERDYQGNIFMILNYFDAPRAQCLFKFYQRPSVCTSQIWFPLNNKFPLSKSFKMLYTRSK